MNRTFKRKFVNGRKFNLLTLPGTNFFKFEVINGFGSNIERVVNATLPDTNVYGLSHFIEHLGFRAPQDFTTDELMAAIKTEGVYNASTDLDRINYWFKSTMDKLDIAVRLVCNYTFNTLESINNEEFQTEKKVVYNEAKRYADDDQTMFYFNAPAALCGYHAEDNVIGIPETIDNFTIEDAIRVKEIFLRSGPQVYNITYDPTIMSEEAVIARVEAELNRFTLSNDSSMNESIPANYHNALGTPGTGHFQLENESEQFMTSLCLDVITPADKKAADVGNAYLARYAETSLTDLIREQNGLTYGVNLFAGLIAYTPYTMFLCDVTRGTEDQMMELFNQSINESVDGYSEANHNKTMDSLKLKRALTYLDQEKYTGLHWLDFNHPAIVGAVTDILERDVDEAFATMDDMMMNYDKVREYLNEVKEVVNTKQYGRVTN